MKRWIVPPSWRLDNSEPPRMVWDYRFPEKFEEVPDEEAIWSCVELLDGSPVGEASIAQPREYTDDFIRGQIWRKHPDYAELYIVVEMKGWSAAYAQGIPRVAYVQGRLTEAGFRLALGHSTFPIYGASGGPTSRICFPVLDRVGSTRGSKDTVVL